MILAPIQTLVAEIGSMFGSGEERPATIMGTIGVQLATTKSRGLLNRSGFMLLLILFMVVSSWGACNVISGTAKGCSNTSSCEVAPVYGCVPQQLAATGEISSCNDNTYITSRVKIYCGDNGTQDKVLVSGTAQMSSCSGMYSNGKVSFTLTYCSNQCEADSLACVQNGDTWTSGTGGQCGACNACTQNDTSFVISSCAYDPSRGQYINMQDHHRIKDCQDSSWQTQYYSSQCDTTQNDSNYQCIGTVNGRDVYMRSPWGATFSCKADGSCARAMQMIAAGECEVPNRPTSSASGGNSSDSQESSSSEIESSESNPNSSDSQPESGTSAMVELPERLYDSLGHIDYNIEFMQPFVTGIYDATWEMSGTLHDVNQNTRNTADNTAGILEKSTNIDNKLTLTNGLLTDIKNKNWLPNINVQPPQVNVENNTDVSGIQQRQDKTRDTLHHTNELLDSNKSLLHGILDWVSKGVTMDSFKQIFNVDSSGWGRLSEEISGAGDSLINQYGGIMAINGCDTTGGHKCDNAVIGVGGLDSAKKSVKSVYGELRDSMLHGAFMDSLNNWGSAFTGGGVLVGSGSNNCPSFLARPHTITIGNSTTQMRLDGVLCATLFGSVTPWTLARVLIRSIVAFFCMVALFKAATGTMFTSEDE